MSLAPGVAVAGDYYLRGGVGLDRPGEAAFTDTDCASTVPAAFYGCGTGGDGAPYRSVGRFGTVPAVELGLGYATGAIRFEVRWSNTGRTTRSKAAPISWRRSGGRRYRRSCRRCRECWPASSTSPRSGCPSPARSRRSSGPASASAHTRIGKTTMTFPATTTIVPGGSRTGTGLDGDGRGRGGAGGARYTRSGLALQRPGRSAARRGDRAGLSGGTGAGSRCRSIWRRRGRG